MAKNDTHRGLPMLSQSKRAEERFINAFIYVDIKSLRRQLHSGKLNMQGLVYNSATKDLLLPIAVPLCMNHNELLQEFLEHGALVTPSYLSHDNESELEIVKMIFGEVAARCNSAAVHMLMKYSTEEELLKKSFKYAIFRATDEYRLTDDEGERKLLCEVISVLAGYGLKMNISKIDRCGYELCQSIVEKNVNSIKTILNKYKRERSKERLDRMVQQLAVVTHQTEIVELLLDNGGNLIEAFNAARVMEYFDIVVICLERITRAKFTGNNIPLTLKEADGCHEQLYCEYGDVFARMLKKRCGSKTDSLYARIHFYHQCQTSDCLLRNDHLAIIKFIDEKYVFESQKMINRSVDNIKFSCLDQEQLLEEVGIMKSIHLSCKTSYRSGVTMYDFMLIDRNQTARLTRNPKLIEMYNENSRELVPSFYHYWPIVKHQFERGSERKDLIESFDDLLSRALGYRLNDEIINLISYSFSNQQLQTLVSNDD